MTSCISSDQSPTSPIESTEVIPTRNELLTLFKETRLKNPDQVLSTEYLVDLLGGMDTVMDIVLNSMDHRMTPDNIVAMQQHLKEGVPSSTRKVLKWTLNPHNNMLYAISPFIHRHLFSKIIIGIVFGGWSLLALFYVLFAGCAKRVMYVYLALNLYYFLVGIPFVVAFLLRINNSMIPKIVRTADFWITAGSAVVMSIYYGFVLFYDNSDHVSLTVSILYFCWHSVGSSLFFISVCCLDGIDGLTPKSRIQITTTVAIICGSLSFFYGFVREEKVIQIPYLGDYGRISTTGGMANYTQILCLFLAKMALNSWRKRGRCILVKYSPFIEWIDTLVEDHSEKTRVEIQHPKGVDFEEIHVSNNSNL